MRLVIFEDQRVPEVFHTDIALNKAIVESKSEFEVPGEMEKQKPTPDQVRVNKEKWGFAG